MLPACWDGDGAPTCPVRAPCRVSGDQTPNLAYLKLSMNYLFGIILEFPRLDGGLSGVNPGPATLLCQGGRGAVWMHAAAPQ